MGLTVAHQEQMGRWVEALAAEKRRRPPQVADYASLRSWAISRLLPEAKNDPDGRARLDYVLGSHWLELGPPKPAAVLTPSPVSPVATPTESRWFVLLDPVARLGLVVCLLSFLVLGFLAGRRGAIEQVQACLVAETPLDAKTACPAWALPPAVRP